ncbi:hypothetical protein ACF0H5_022993 [Mactra antiquata]
MTYEWNFCIERAYRLGPYIRGKTRPILVVFDNYADIDWILSKAYLLRGTEISVNKDFPSEIASARKELWLTYKQIKRDNPTSKITLAYPAKIVRDKEVIVDRFPHWDELLNSSTKSVVTQQRSKTTNQPINATKDHVCTHVTEMAREFTPVRPTASMNDNVTEMLDNCDYNVNTCTTQGASQANNENTSTPVGRTSRAKNASKRNESISPDRCRRRAAPVRRSTSGRSEDNSFSRPWTSSQANSNTSNKHSDNQ